MPNSPNHQFTKSTIQQIISDLFLINFYQSDFIYYQTLCIQGINEVSPESSAVSARLIYLNSTNTICEFGPVG